MGILRGFMFDFLKKFVKKDSPDKIFKELKANKHTISDEELNKYVKNMQIMASEFIQTGLSRSGKPIF